MGLQWAMVSEVIDDKDLIVGWLQKGYEPFSVDNGRVYLRTQQWVEDDEPRSSVHHPNRAGNEPDEIEEEEDDQ